MTDEELDKKISAWTRTIKKTDSSILEKAKAYCNRGSAQAQFIKPSLEAITDIKKSIEMAGEINLSENIDEVKKMEESEKRKILYNAYCNLGLTYRELKQYGKAIDLFTKALEELEGKLEDVSDIYLNLGSTYIDNEDYDKAVEQYQKYLETNPKDYDIHKNLGYVYGLKGSREMALEHYKKAYEAADKDYQKKELFFDIWASSSGIKEMDFVLNGILDIEDNENLLHRICSRYSETVKKHGYVYGLCKEIYMRTLQIMRLLFVDFSEKESYVTHYTAMRTAEKMLYENNKLRMCNMDEMNDMAEGEILFHYLGLGMPPRKDKYDCAIPYGASFSFAVNSLNQFRLYGKKKIYDTATNESAGKEATGLCLTFKGSFFADKIKSAVKYKFEYDKEEDGKHPLFRCVYINSHGDILSIGESEDECENNKNSFSELKDAFAKLKRLVSEIKNNWPRCDADSKNALCEQLISDLLMNIRYLVKDASYREERECRIVSIVNVKEYLEALPIKEHISRIYYASEVENETYEYGGKKEKGSTKLDNLKEELNESSIEIIPSHHSHRNK